MKTLHLLPNVLHPESAFSFTPPPLDALIAESDKGGWTYLKRFSLPKMPVYLLNEHTSDLSPLLAIPEASVGLISDAGMPCLADPGSALVAEARNRNVEIHAYPGPSSILLALMLSGFSGQKFLFHGYAPRELKNWSLEQGMTHIFIEAPYRNNKLLEFLVKSLKTRDRLCVASNLTGANECVMSQTIERWRKGRISDLKGKPTVFLIWVDRSRLDRRH